MSPEASRVCNWLAVPLSTRVWRPFTKLEVVLAAALAITTALAEGALRVSVNVPWILVLPSPSSKVRPVKYKGDAALLVIGNWPGPPLIAGAEDSVVDTVGAKARVADAAPIP